MVRSSRRRLPSDAPSKLPREGRRLNPDWTEDETLLALDAYFRLRPRFPRPDHDVTIELSTLLRLYGRLRGVVAADSFRNAEGVARKVGKFRAAERGDAPMTVRGAELEGLIWARHGHRPEDVALAADALRARIYETAAEQDSADDEAASPVIPPLRHSRGPRPAPGERMVQITDGECVVYVLELAGATAGIFPDHDLSGRCVVKIGRSNLVHRRLRELNAGFPRLMACRWRVMAVRPFPSADDAHDFEQALLQRLTDQTLSLGDEFAVVDRSGAAALLNGMRDEQPRRR